MIRKFDDKDIDKIMNIWLTSTIKGHEFISEEYWKNNYDSVKNIYIPISQTFVIALELTLKRTLTLALALGLAQA